MTAPLSGLHLEISIRDRSGRVQNFYNADQEIVDAMKDAMLETALETQTLAFEYCPVDTGFMRDHIEVVTSENLQDFEIGWRAETFFAAGLKFYPMYVVFGTRFMPARDPLTPAYEATKPLYQQRIAEAIQTALAKRRVS